MLRFTLRIALWIAKPHWWNCNDWGNRRSIYSPRERQLARFWVSGGRKRRLAPIEIARHTGRRRIVDIVHVANSLKRDEFRYKSHSLAAKERD